MNTDQTPDSTFHHQQVSVDDVSIHAVTAGLAGKPVILFLHGFSENWLAFKDVMTVLANNFYVVAVDLPGVGKSDKIDSVNKRTIARYVKGVVDSMGLTNVTLVGHDVGGMVA